MVNMVFRVRSSLCCTMADSLLFSESVLVLGCTRLSLALLSRWFQARQGLPTVSCCVNPDPSFAFGATGVAAYLVCTIASP